MPGALMFEEIEEIARNVEEMEKSRSELAQRLRFNSGKIAFTEAFEREMFYPVKSEGVNCSVAAVDGGILSEEFHGFDLLIGRSVGVVFEYENSKVKTHKYFPSAIPPMKYDIKNGLDMRDMNWHKSLFRMRGEIECATEIMEKHKPKYLMLDGSIAPLVSDKPADDSQVRPLYDEVAQKYQQLYETAQKNGVTLLGVIKDSRGRRFNEILEKHAEVVGNNLRNASDTNFLFFLLEKGERTFAFRYSNEPARHQVLKDLGQWADKILTFYLKAVELDRPIRVEFLSGGRGFDEIASLVYSLSQLNRRYAYPAVLIEADLRAAMDGHAMQRVRDALALRLSKSSSALRLRRNTRPFR